MISLQRTKLSLFQRIDIFGKTVHDETVTTSLPMKSFLFLVYSLSSRHPSHFFHSWPYSLYPPEDKTHRQCLNTRSMLWESKFEQYDLKLIYVSMRNFHVLPFSIKIMYLRMNKDKNPEWPQVRHCCNWHNKKKFFNLCKAFTVFCLQGSQLYPALQDCEYKQIG